MRMGSQAPEQLRLRGFPAPSQVENVRDYPRSCEQRRRDLLGLLEKLHARKLAGVTKRGDGEYQTDSATIEPVLHHVRSTIYAGGDARRAPDGSIIVRVMSAQELRRRDRRDRAGESR